MEISNPVVISLINNPKMYNIKKNQKNIKKNELYSHNNHNFNNNSYKFLLNKKSLQIPNLNYDNNTNNMFHKFFNDNEWNNISNNTYNSNSNINLTSNTKQFIKFNFDNTATNNGTNASNLSTNEYYTATTTSAPQSPNILNTTNIIIQNNGIHFGKVMETGNIAECRKPAIICTNCGNEGHIFKNCDDAVISYGLICFINKNVVVPESNINNDYFNKRTKKKDKLSNKSTNLWNCETPKIKILKRNETITHTLKNMMCLTGNVYNDTSNNSTDTDTHGLLESIIDIEGTNSLIANTNNPPDTDTVSLEINNKLIENLSTNSMVGVVSECENTLQNSDIINENNIGAKKEIKVQKIILVQRRNTIGFIEFIRGKYDVKNQEYIIKLFNMMTFDEKRLLREHDNFDTIRTIIGLRRECHYKNEYDDAKNKFIELRNNPEGNLIFKLLDKSQTRWNSPEWGIPKGRKNHKEFEIDCAIREFTEETGIKAKHIDIYRNVKPLEEVYKGINGVIYKHIYYLASIKDTEEAKINIELIEKGGMINHEVSNVRLFGLGECHKIIRPYYISKLNVIKKGFQIINSMKYYFE